MASSGSVRSIPRRETPDIETSSDDYERRFAGVAGRFFLDTQAAGVEQLMHDLHGCSVLEVGGGHAQLVPVFLRNECRLTMLGSDECTHTKVRAKFPDADIRLDTGNLVDLPYPDRSFDVVTAVRLVSHVEAWQTLLAELCRVARKTVIIDYPSWRSLNALTPLLFGFKRSIEGNTRIYASFRPSRLSAELESCGFEVSSSYGQFFLPMFAHRALSGARPLQVAEKGFRRVGLTSAFGSPVLLRADRTTQPERRR